MQSVSIETSFISFLRDNSSAPVNSATRQSLTRRWWDVHRQRYEVVTSQYVLDEARMGSEALAREQSGHLAGIPLTPLSDLIDMLGEADDDRAT